MRQSWSGQNTNLEFQGLDSACTARENNAGVCLALEQPAAAGIAGLLQTANAGATG